MNRFILGLKALFRVWFDGSVAEGVARALEGPVEEAAPPPPQPTRSDALTLLAVLQREGRLVDFLMEPIESYSDAQIGAAVRDVHRGCAAALERMVALEPLFEQSEGSPVTVPVGFDPLTFRLVGNVTGSPPHEGVLYHHGWQAGRCEIPEWSGHVRAISIVAPAEVEIS